MFLIAYLIQQLFFTLQILITVLTLCKKIVYYLLTLKLADDNLFLKIYWNLFCVASDWIIFQ